MNPKVEQIINTKEIASRSCSTISKRNETCEGTENVQIHVPTLCVAQQIYETFAAIKDMLVRCRWCGVCKFIFRNDLVKQFVNLVTRTTKCFKKIICIAHNAKAFDAQFILKYLVGNYERTAGNFKRDGNYRDVGRKH